MIIELDENIDKEIKIKFVPNETSSEISEVEILEVTPDTT